ncbi:MAG: sigma-70 family RNA polymerase sigma factor [Planctomycetales bacterium]|nr:sigma-70 family RNA polymerase sigma factor [Planctomycetales bacterium]
MPNELEDSDETLDLIDRAQAGDRDAFDLLFQRYSDELYRFVNLRLDARIRSRVAASDIVQDTQLEAFRRFVDYCQRKPMPFRVWLRKNAYERLLNVRRDHVQTAKRAIGREQPLLDESSVLLAGKMSDSMTSPSERVSKLEYREAIAIKIQSMSEDDRNVLLMRHVEGMSHQDIANVLGIEHATSRKRYARALVKLEMLLRESGFDQSK